MNGAIVTCTYLDALGAHAGDKLTRERVRAKVFVREVLEAVTCRWAYEDEWCRRRYAFKNRNLLKQLSCQQFSGRAGRE